ncbi:MAG: hypothetical protein IJQ28_04935, partial [Clostridia bacterium]|nr:hypothetical protein [Clostridia bacterium]
YHFGLYSKLLYRGGLTLSVRTSGYTYVNPELKMPKIITSASGASSITEIKKFFCSEYTVKLVAEQTGINYETLIGGNYKILIEPVAYFLFKGDYYAMSATQAALYDQMLSGGLRSKMVSLTHKNLPLAMFLEHPDLGYPAWTGSTTEKVSNDTIISSLGLGIVKFREEPEPPREPETEVYDYTYRTDTDVITSVRVDAREEYNPDRPLSVTFKILSSNYVVRNIVIPSGESQLVWVKWHTPTAPQVIPIRVTVGSSIRTINVRVEELVENEPPDPKATDRNDAFTVPSTPYESGTATLSWGTWSARWHAHWVWISNWVWNGSSWEDRGHWEDHGWYDFTYNPYSASITVTQVISPDSKDPTRRGQTMKSGYGFNTNTAATVTSTATTGAYTQAQTSVMYFPEFSYETYFRVLDKTVYPNRSQFRFKENKYSTYRSRAHFTPIWYPDGVYTAYAKIYDAWTPAGMLWTTTKPTVNISGNLFSDWHIAPTN